MTEDYLLQEVAPRIRAGINSSLPRSSGEDDAELLQDGLAIVLTLLQSAEARDKKVSAGNVAYYTQKHLRAGRRSTGYRKNDPLHPASQLNGCRVYSLHESVPTDTDEDLTLSEVLASQAEDPSVEAGRRLDWQGLMHKLDDVAKAILRALADGSELTRLVTHLKLSRSTLQTRKAKLAVLIRECLGDDILQEVQTVAEPEGARLLICSEIGSEGRNFQFAHHLVLFDLPLHPELLEQRIGRLDRIGQTESIHIHVPYLTHSPQEVLARWYHEGLNAFECNLEGGDELFRQSGQAIRDLALEFHVMDRATADKNLAGLVKRTRAAHRRIRRLLEQGRDRLLELISFRPVPAQQVIRQIQEQDGQPDLEDYLLDVFDHFGVHIEELAPHTWQLNPQGIVTDAFPSMPAEGMIATCDRRRALSREDVAFLTWDHPLVSGAMDLLLGAETGNCAFAVLPTANERTLLLELIFVLETIAAPRLHADRFLPLTPIRLVLNHRLKDVSGAFHDTTWERRLQKGSPSKLIDHAAITRRTLPAMFEAAARLAETQAAALRQAALQTMSHLLGHEVERLQTLAKVNDQVRPQEIRLATVQQEQLATALRQSCLRLDAVRLIWQGPPEALR